MSPYLKPLSRVLVLTSDSLGSTYFQRLLTLYLTLNDHPTLNLHEIVNGYCGSFRNLLISLVSFQKSIVCRTSRYRLHEIKEKHDNIYKVLNLFFNRFFCVKRNHFETALSLSIRDFLDHPLNVYNSSEFYAIQPKSSIEIPFTLFKNNLKHIQSHHFWVENNFKEVEWISYDDLIFDTDSLLKSLFSFDSDYSFQKANKNIVRHDRGLEQLNEETLILQHKIDQIKEQNPSYPFSLSRKKFTLSEKRKMISNFDELFLNYQKIDSNFLDKMTNNDLELLINREESFYGLS